MPDNMSDVVTSRPSFDVSLSSLTLLTPVIKASMKKSHGGLKV